MPCPRFVGRTQTTLGTNMPMLLPDMSEMLQHSLGSDDIYRYAYPVNGSAPIEVFTLSDGASYATMDHNGALWWVTDTGEVYKRATPTSAGSDTLITTLPGPYFLVPRIAYSNYDQNIYVVSYTSAAPNTSRFHRIELDGTVTLLLSEVSDAFESDTIVAAGEDIWTARFEGPLGRFMRFHLPDVSFAYNEAAAGTFSNVALAVNHQGQPIAQATAGVSTLTAGSILGSIMNMHIVSLGCSQLDGPSAQLQSGAEVPGNPSRAVMSHYIEFTGTPDADWIWEWPGGGRYVGKVGRGGPRA